MTGHVLLTACSSSLNNKLPIQPAEFECLDLLLLRRTAEAILTRGQAEFFGSGSTRMELAGLGLALSKQWGINVVKLG